MRVFRPKTVTLDGEKFSVHIDQTVYVHRHGLRRVKDHELARRVVTELRRLATPPPPREPSDEEVKRAAMDREPIKFRSRVR